MPNECYDWSIITYKKCVTSLTNWWTCSTKYKKNLIHMQGHIWKKSTNKTLNTCTRYAGQAVGQLLNSTKHTSTFSNTHNI